MSPADNAEFRSLLDQERERILSALAHIRESSAKSTPEEDSLSTKSAPESHLGDMASVTFERELEEGLEESAQQTLAEIDRAVAKLDDGTYGVCERCGREIGEERLRVRPWALLCIDDQRLVSGG